MTHTQSKQAALRGETTRIAACLLSVIIHIFRNLGADTPDSSFVIRLRGTGRDDHDAVPGIRVVTHIRQRAVLGKREQSAGLRSLLSRQSLR